MEMIVAGPIGGPVSNTDSRWDEKGKTTLTHILVSYDSSYITSVQFGYTEDGALVMSAKHGSSSGYNFRLVKLNHNEYVTGLSGLTSLKGINSLPIYTNLGKHGPICERVGIVPLGSYPTMQEIDLRLCDRGEFGGFFGSHDTNHLTSIGIYVNPISRTKLLVKKMITMGPLGHFSTGSGCFEWDETPHNVISHINISFNKHGVTSIQFGYVENGAVVMSDTYGSSSSVCSRRVLRLNHETEFVTGIHGEIYNGYISSLAFCTNERTHYAVHWTFDSVDDVGLEKMEFHSGILERREFVGFFGTCDHSQLKSIGFYVRPVDPNVMETKGEDVSTSRPC